MFVVFDTRRVIKIAKNLGYKILHIRKKCVYLHIDLETDQMVDVAQLVRVEDCGS